MNETGVNEFVDLIREIVRQELKHSDSTILCRVEHKRDDTHFDLSIVPNDTQALLRNIANQTRFDIAVGDYVYVYKINNQLNNCFICYKVGG